MIKSMTAYASLTHEGEWGSLTWEIRSLNHRYLDVLFRLPENFKSLEIGLRKQASQQLTRGKVECILKYKPGETSISNFKINTKLIKEIARTTKELDGYFDKQLLPISPLHLLNWQHVLQLPETHSSSIDTKAKSLYKKALINLIDGREKEGAALRAILNNKLQSMTRVHKKIQTWYPQTIKNHQSKLLNHLKQVSSKLDAQRLEQEMVYFAQKADIAEELDRLQSHINEIERILKKGGVIGKRLDFFMQELNREANTVASKSTDKRITHASVELKVFIEQMREQVQNIE